ncbi:hypothetical protein MMC10_002041 [Thelotrema lepadinum]|nr:hypothetical protein [Thelotrema lepadinum]
MAGTTASASQPLSTTSSSFTDQLHAASTDPTVAGTIQHLKPSRESLRKRRRSLEVPNSNITSNESLKSPSPIRSPLQPTGAGEMAEQKRRKLDKSKEQSQQTSRNPQADALNALLDPRMNATSQADPAPNPAATSLSAPIAAIAPSISVPDQHSGAASEQTSPLSATSTGPIDSASMATIPAPAPEVASPGQIGDDDGQEDAPAEPDNSLNVDSTPSNKAFSYPGPLAVAQMDAKRGMSLPGSGLRDVSRSPSTSNKKHKCPYCSTEFTRHHNLKSHLLTHSHEKPYLCQQCDSRFRRLHDLKRHSKLHTGERPHVCPKCNRSFARGDALARHNKGLGGCAGRRSSVGSYGADGAGDESMDGMVYTNEASDEPENMMDDDAATGSVPSIRHFGPGHAPFRADTQMSDARQPSTYPPVAARANMGGGLQPPAAPHSGSSGGHNSIGSGSSFQPGTSYPPGNVLGGPPMTESPKPLSPGQHPLSAGDPRNRSPSISSSLGQNYGRRGTHRGSPPSLPPPPAPSSGPHLPSLPSLAPPDSRYTLSSQAAQGAAGSLPNPQGGSYPGANGGVRTSASNSLSSHGSHPHGSGERGNLPFGTEERMIALVRSLEAKVDNLQEEVRQLRGQLHQQQQQPPPVEAPGPLPTGHRG